MTVFTDIACLYVAQVLSSSIDAIVTTRAVAGDVQVIKIRWSPGVGRMTVVTRITAR